MPRECIVVWQRAGGALSRVENERVESNVENAADACAVISWVRPEACATTRREAFGLI